MTSARSMINGSGRLKLAVQRKGRLTEHTIGLLKQIGLSFESYGQRLFSQARNFPLSILYARDDDIADYVVANVVDPLSRVEGVGSTQVFGSQYAMRIWLDPNKLHTYALSIPEVTTAIRARHGYPRAPRAERHAAGILSTVDSRRCRTATG